MKCSNCGSDIPEGSRFCANCGTAIGAAGAAAGAAAVAATPPAAAQPVTSAPAPPPMAAAPPPPPPPQMAVGGPPPAGGGPNRNLVIGGLVGAAVIAVAAFLLLKGGGNKDDNKSVLAPTPTVAAVIPSGATASPTTRTGATATPTVRAGTTPAASSTPSGGAAATGTAGKLADLTSYKFNLKIEGFGGPLEDVAATFAALQPGSPTPNQTLTMEVTGAFVKPDRGQQTLKLGSFTVEFTTIGRQQWAKVFGIQTGPDSASRSTEDYSFAASLWDEGLIDAFGSFGCSGTETVNSVQTKKCGVDEKSLGSLIGAFGGLVGDPSSGIKEITRGTMQAWLAQQGNFPVRIRFDISGKGANGKDFQIKMDLDVTDVNSSAIKIDPPR